MGVYTHIRFLNANDPEYIKARDGTPEDRQQWEDDQGIANFDDRPGKTIEVNTAEHFTETEDEYGGWIIPIATLPPGTTHILVTRG